MKNDHRLKLRAISTEDIQILSALLQDGLVSASDLHYDKDEASFVMVVNRFCWEQADDKTSETQLNRCLCGLKVGYVKQVCQRGLSKGSNQFYNLLSITYEEIKENENSMRSLILTFSDGCGIRLAVGELALILQDIAEPHPGLVRPHHNND